jgi:hypothetical protein
VGLSGCRGISTPKAKNPLRSKRGRRTRRRRKDLRYQVTIVPCLLETLKYPYSTVLSKVATRSKVVVASYYVKVYHAPKAAQFLRFAYLSLRSISESQPTSIWLFKIPPCLFAHFNKIAFLSCLAEQHTHRTHARTYLQQYRCCELLPIYITSLRFLLSIKLRFQQGSIRRERKILASYAGLSLGFVNPYFLAIPAMECIEEQRYHSNGFTIQLERTVWYLKCLENKLCVSKLFR